MLVILRGKVIQLIINFKITPEVITFASSEYIYAKYSTFSGS